MSETLQDVPRPPPENVPPRADETVPAAVAPSVRRKRVVIVGGGFAGIAAARALRHCDADVILIDRRNHHIFQPLLYQVATAVLGTLRDRCTDPAARPQAEETSLCCSRR